jgi:hypothetical protein
MIMQVLKTSQHWFLVAFTYDAMLAAAAAAASMSPTQFYDFGSNRWSFFAN